MTALPAAVPETVEALTERYGGAYRWLVMGAALVGMLTMVLSSTSIAVAVPDVMGAFGVGQDQAQWLSTGFFAAQTATMLMTAWLTHNVGYRPAFLGALLLFTVAAFVGGLAPTLDFVILARVVQGACAGIMQPLSMSLIFVVFPAERRGTAMGIFSLGVVLAPAVGPALGGLAVDIFSWRYVFFLPLPACAMALVMGSLFMPVRRPDGEREPFDWAGLALLCIALAAILDAFASAQREGWNSDQIVLEFVIGIAALLALVLWSMRAPTPIVAPAIFANRRFAAAFAVGFLFGFCMFGSIYITSVFVQTVQGYTATRAGLLLLPGGILMALMFPISGRLTDLVPPAIPLLTGLVLFAAGFLLMSASDRDTAFWTFVLFLLVNRGGLSLTMPALNMSALRALRPDQVGQGAGLINFSRMLGGACGTNLMVVMLEMRTRLYAESFTATQTWDNSSSDALLRAVRGLMARDGVTEIERKAGAIDYLGQIVHGQASMLAFQEVFLATGVLGFLALAPALLLARSAQRAAAAGAIATAAHH